MISFRTSSYLPSPFLRKLKRCELFSHITDIAATSSVYLSVSGHCSSTFSILFCGSYFILTVEFICDCRLFSVCLLIAVMWQTCAIHVTQNVHESTRG